MKGPVRVGRHKLSVWDEPDDRLVARVLFPNPTDSGPEFDLEFSTYVIEQEQHLQAASEHHARSSNPDPPVATEDYWLEGLLVVIPAVRSFPFQLISHSHAVSNANEGEVLALVASLRALPERRLRRTREQVLGYIEQQHTLGDPEWVTYLSEPGDRPRRWNQALEKYRRRTKT